MSQQFTAPHKDKACGKALSAGNGFILCKQRNTATGLVRRALGWL